jgi:hypothetical protein
MSDQRRNDQTEDPLRPSQAEGDRGTVEQDLKEQSDKRRRSERATGERRNDPPRPSQAEGERDKAEEAEKK